MYKKKFPLLLLFIFFAVGLGIVYTINKNKTSTRVISLPSPTPPYVVNKQGDAVIADQEMFEILHQPNYNKYIITIKVTDFEAARRLAEQTFLEVTGLTNEAACRMDVTIGIPYYVDPQKAGVLYQLSFCAGPNKLTAPLPVDPSLQSFSLLSTSQTVNVLEIGGTRNPLFIGFTNEINPKTAFVQIQPFVETEVRFHPKNKKEMIVVPMSAWVSGVKYTLIIQAGLMSLDEKSQLKDNLLLTYEIKPAPTPEPEIHVTE